MAQEHGTYADFLRILGRSTDLLNDDPIREEIFSVERLEQYAAYLAGQLRVSPVARRGRSLLSDLKRSTGELIAAYGALTEDIREKRSVTPAAEWFVDNFHIVEDQLREIKEDLPENYYHELPKIAEGELCDFPRVYAIALAILAHTDSRLDEESLRRFIVAFQGEAPLSIGELWAIPITLRIALVQHLKHMAQRIVTARQKRTAGDLMADELLSLAALPETEPRHLVEALARALDRPENFDRAYIVQLTQRLRDQDPDVWPAFDWLEKQLLARGTNTQKVVELDHFRQAAAQVTVGNIISSMRLLSALNWRDFFEDVSLLEPLLSQDPTETYADMDFGTRDAYRHAIERISKRSPLGELEVARQAVEIARAEHRRNPADLRRAHVGYYLIDQGIVELERACRHRPGFRQRTLRFLLRHPTPAYLLALSVLTLLFLAPPLAILAHAGWGGAVLAFFGVLAIFPASEFALTLINHYVPFFVPPKVLPKMDLTQGVPTAARTMVVIPTLLTSLGGVRELLETLEVHFLANQDPAISFAILGDFADAETEHRPEDGALLALALKGIERLNKRYGGFGGETFHLFHRARLHNPAEGQWIGWERKRGKLQEFNRLLRGAQDTSYVVATASQELLARIRYVITLDSDTQLPRDSARRLIGTILHPLNQPVIDPNQRRVTRGYGILQPRVSVSLVSAAQTRFARVFSGNIGLDPYTTAVSDVYQDFFAEGSFTGKGLYVVDAFEAALRDRVPDNSLLSHDLFEGNYARSALVTDIELIDDYPPNYEVFSKRQHRWTRGDWQIARWLLPWVPNHAGRWVRNDLPLIARWKIFDNLRRTLVPVAILAWLLLAWTLLPGSSLRWTGFILLMLVFPIYAPVTKSMWFLRWRGPWSNHLREIWAGTRMKIWQSLLTICFLPREAFNQLDAITRSLYRQLVSRKKMLEWTTFAAAQSSSRLANNGSPLAWIRSPGPLVSVLALGALVAWRPSALPSAIPFLLLWSSTPFLTRWLRGGGDTGERGLTDAEVLAFRGYARRTWHFFEIFANEGEHWLAPDNYQEDPTPVVAHRTSPTNIGLHLLALVSAYDFGYLGLTELIEKLERVFETLVKMERLRGHFFNWYDTTTLAPLRPRYISTVDSGNLAAHLLALKQACGELGRRPIVHARMIDGLADTLGLMDQEMIDLEGRRSGLDSGALREVRQSIARSQALVSQAQYSRVSEWNSCLTVLSVPLLEIEDMLEALAVEGHRSQVEQAQVLAKAASRQVHEFARDLRTLTPWPSLGETHPLSEDWSRLQARIPTLTEIASIPASEQGSEAALDLLARRKALMDRCDEFVFEMNFRFLFDEKRKIFAIGYNVAEGRLDNSYYDLLASESRLASFIAIAKGDVPQEHWFHLGRQMTLVSGGPALVSWTATMFEYLMPLLVMRSYPSTLLTQTYFSVVARQIEYGKQRNVPWGVSEAGYNARDLQLNYQYGPFGVPGLGLKRGLSDELVVSPYSTMLAAMVDPPAAAANLRELERSGVLSRYGFFESIDYTPQRLQKKQKSFLLRSFMAHHQGMSLVSINNLLNADVMRTRFHAEPLVQAAQLLLQERVPQNVSLLRPRAEEVGSESFRRLTDRTNPRTYVDMHLPTPRTQILSNGRYSVMISSAGSGYSKCGPLAVSRWREDVTRDAWGQFFYVRDREAGKLWSPGFHPLGNRSDRFEVTFAEDRIEIWRTDADVGTHTEIIVSPEDDVELRRISLTNNSSLVRELEVTSFLEPVLARGQDDAAHLAFSNLFVQTEFVPGLSALLATRRLRSQNEKQVWGFHVLVPEGSSVGPIQFETDRARFLGRGRSVVDPVVILEDRPLSNTTGAVLDPIFSLRGTMRLAPGETARLTFATGIASSRDEALRLADKYHDIHIFAREAEIAWTKSQVQLRHLNIDADAAHVYQRLGGRILYSDPSLRPRAHALSRNVRSQANLWAYGISGDVPIVLSRIRDEKDMAMVRELLHAHEYLRLKGLPFDLVILNERAHSYLQPLQEEIQRQIRISGSQEFLDKPGGIFLRRADHVSPDDIDLLKAVARVSLNAEKGTLSEQLQRRPPDGPVTESFPAQLASRPTSVAAPVVPELSFFNGIGGFGDHGRTYVIVLKDGQSTPAPWINVVANSHDFGFVVSESGSGYTWSVNSRENRLTPWSNDAVSDPPGEAIFIRDEDTGEFWSPTPLPLREAEAYVVTHGQGYSRFQHTSHDLQQDLLLFVPLNDSVKVGRLKMKNFGAGTRRLSVTAYTEWVLGFHRGSTAHYVVTEVDASGVILARNAYNNEFASRVAFADINLAERSFTCDRKEFIGRNGSLARPLGMRSKGLSGAVGAGLDPCAAFQAPISIPPGGEVEVLVLLGQAENRESALEIALRYRSSERVTSALREVETFWEQTLGAVQVKTPDAALDIMVNHWLLYQTLSCRIWARSAFYQSGGAFGFRDQLQDVMALVYTRPELAREQILRAASRQFPQGDVQHWWHPPTGRGVRTHFSDDLLWLPFVTSYYVEVTGDRTVLQESVSFIEAPELAEGQDDDYRQPATSAESATLLEHCARTLDRSLRVGVHGLPLMGAGDWNDGMNRVGHAGKGESVWMGWFLCSVIERFLPLCESAGQSERAARYRAHRENLRKALEENAWDGSWYRRAYFDDGTPLGSASDEECRIDSIAQSWAVLSGAGDPARASGAMAAVDEYLVHRGDGLIKLFTPPFDKTTLDPGYIKGYLPGVRENGGQYTHAALWTLMAYAEQGDGDRAGELYALLNPINHSSTRAGLHKYRVEPYVAAADIYGMSPHVGRGGWTWYTGSASWMYRAAVESILGFRVLGGRLHLRPCIPSSWRHFEISYRFGGTRYEFVVSNPDALMRPAQAWVVDLVDDGKKHRIEFVMSLSP